MMNNRFKVKKPFVLVSAVLLAAAASAVIMQSAGFRLLLAWVGGGGSRATSAGFSNVVSVGQGVAGPVISGGTVRLRGGFIQAFTVGGSTNTNCNVVNPALDTVCTIVGPSGAITLTIPGGALNQAAVITLSIPGSFPAGLSNMADFIATGRGVVTALAPNLSPRLPMRLDFTYLDADATPGNEDRLRLAEYDTFRGLWNPLVGRQDTTANTLTIFTLRFGTFQMLELIPGPNIESPVISPNPFRPSQGHTRMVFGRLPEGATVDIFTLSGERVRALSVDGAGQAAWDVRNDQGEQVVSGSYLAVIRLGSENRVITVAVER